MSDETRRAALEAAFDKSEEVVDDTPVPGSTDAPAEGSEAPDDDVGGAPEGQGQEGQGEPKEEDGQDPQTIEQKAALKDQTKQGEQKAPEQTPAVGDVKPPASWSKEERAHWGKIPKEAQAAIQRREAETTRVLSQSAGARKFANDFLQTVNPYAHIIRAQNSTPLQAVDNLMKTASWLTTGNAGQKASVVADIIANYGVDIETLVEAIKGRRAQVGTQGQGTQAIDPAIANALKPINEFMSRAEQAQQRRAEQLMEKADADVEEFIGQHDFADDLRDDMADIMEIAESRGKTMTLKQAYDKALVLREDLFKAVQQKKNANGQGVRRSAADVAQARARASTISGGPANGGGRGAATTRRQALEQAWDDRAQ